MSASHFLSLTDLSTVDPVPWDGGPVALQYQRLAERLGPTSPELLAFFAEPLSGAEAATRQVGWYVRHEGKPIPLPELPPNERAAAADTLGRTLQALLPYLDDPTFGPFLGRCLILPGPHDVVFVGDYPVLRNWGFIGKGADHSNAALETGFGQLLGRYARYPKAPWLLAETPGTTPSFPAAPNAPPAGATAAAVPGTGPMAPFPPPQPPRPAPRWIGPLVHGVILASLIAGLGFLCWRVDRPAKSSLSADEQQELAALKREVPTLEERVRVFAAAVQTDLCRPEAAITLPASSESVSAAIDRGIVLILVTAPDKPKAVTIGSGVLIAPNTLVTNRALVETAAANSIFVAGRWLGGTYIGHVVKRSGEDHKVSPSDVALVQLDVAPPGARPAVIDTKLADLSGVHTGSFLDFSGWGQIDLKDVMDGTLSAMPGPAVVEAKTGNDGDEHGGVPTISADLSLMPPGTAFAASFDGCNRLNGLLLRAAGTSDGPSLLPGFALIDLLKQGNIAYTATDAECLAPPVLPPPPGGAS
jgi:hypothetical protein